MKLFLTLILSLTTLHAFAAQPSKGPRKPSDDGQTCVSFNGAGAKKTFTNLYPFTQGKVTAIVAEETRNGETLISTENIFCRVYATGLAGNVDASMKKLNKMSDKKFQCGYFVASDGVLSPCSDPM